MSAAFLSPSHSEENHTHTAQWGCGTTIETLVEVAVALDAYVYNVTPQLCTKPSLAWAGLSDGHGVLNACDSESAASLLRSTELKIDHRPARLRRCVEHTPHRLIP